MFPLVLLSLSLARTSFAFFLVSLITLLWASATAMVAADAELTMTATGRSQFNLEGGVESR